MFVRDFADRTFEELCFDFNEGEEILGETEAQHGFETALYGDSWPGAQLDIRRIRGVQAALKAEIDRRFERFSVLLPPQQDDLHEQFPDIPF